MADLRVIKHYDVKPNVEVQRLWTQQQIAEKEARIKRLEADAEEILRGQIARIQADIIMLKRETASLYQRMDELEKFGKDEVIDIKQLEQQ